MLRITPVRARDMKDLGALMRALARYEKLPPPGPAVIRRVRKALGARDPRLHGLVARRDGKALGYALYVFDFSSFLGRPTLFLEDLFVLPEHRRAGIGGRLFRHCVGLGRKRSCGRMEWAVLDWNAPAHRFYRKSGARPLKGWVVYRMPLRKGAW